ncbi:Bis(5'-nucleosyl)-tetraphosphatase, symmetrical [hydrothermal vent metagenome]|uniref:bis(5'-nucleosyl)-tetraphosphatase (symmetrical) n=1 Tax=hydrothermal vent metagenome TaxID=652676 RepID=A0A1W1BEY1_9ZZZZ
MADYAIGDVQGCFTQLQKLLKKINFSIDKDRLFFLGDVVNRGPQSLETLKFIKNLKDNAKMVLGNHDIHLLVCALTDKKPNKKDTFNDILITKNKYKLLDFLRQQPLVIEHDNNLLVHAGIPHLWSKEKLLKQAQAVEKKLKSSDASLFLSKIYNDEPKKFTAKLNNLQKNIYTINALTRMRFCTSEGTLEFEHKEKHINAPKGYKAWFEHKRLIKENIFFGHWSALKNINNENIYPMDTGCVWGNQLSAINLSDKQMINIDCF